MGESFSFHSGRGLALYLDLALHVRSQNKGSVLRQCAAIASGSAPCVRMSARARLHASFSPRVLSQSRRTRCPHKPHSSSSSSGTTNTPGHHPRSRTRFCPLPVLQASPAGTIAFRPGMRTRTQMLPPRPCAGHPRTSSQELAGAGIPSRCTSRRCSERVHTRYMVHRRVTARATRGLGEHGSGTGCACSSELHFQDSNGKRRRTLAIGESTTVEHRIRNAWPSSSNSSVTNGRGALTHFVP